MTMQTTRFMSKLVDPDGRCYWHHGADMYSTGREAMRATGRTRYCLAVRKAAAVIADIKLRTAIQCGYTRVIEIEDGNRNGLTVDITLPIAEHEAVKAFANLTI